MTPACPHCQHELTPKEIGTLYAGLRKTKGGGVRQSERCPCGAMTLARAAARGHKCLAVGAGHIIRQSTQKT